ncbi:hypothetical protein [Paenibacillus eucommiae]|uniref:DUF2269 family protein n=1 Tax=Paenibacillus eucommiae TaxID=1355755 RepID=A0ABS4IRG3_9BACL|nr:hypothetical protein [Paenibacillus eucommiae]MBP1989486.1 hypothetical protein [Paenibacillus eucommiae]
MYSIMIFIHVISAVLMGSYLVFPFLAGRAAALTGQEQASYTGLLITLNRVGQFSLIVAFITGGAMISKVDVSVIWMIVAIVLLIAIGATTGIMGSNLKRLIVANKEVSTTSVAASKVQTLSWVSGIILLVILYVMTHPMLFS